LSVTLKSALALWFKLHTPGRAQERGG